VGKAGHLARKPAQPEAGIARIVRRLEPSVIENEGLRGDELEEQLAIVAPRQGLGGQRLGAGGIELAIEQGARIGTGHCPDIGPSCGKTSGEGANSMASDLEVAPISGMDDDIAVLIEEAGSAGFPFMETLRREWVSGENRFDAPGECYLAIYRHGEMVAAGGLNRDPYADDPAIGRIRHVSVRKAARRTGAGGAAFYETIGFERCGDETATHVLDLQAAALSAAPPLSTKRLPQ
jgi:hypothetical protein